MPVSGRRMQRFRSGVTLLWANGTAPILHGGDISQICGSYSLVRGVRSGSAGWVRVARPPGWGHVVRRSLDFFCQQVVVGLMLRPRSRNDRRPTSPSRHIAKAVAQVVIVHRGHRRHRWRGKGAVAERLQTAEADGQITASQLCYLPGRRKDQGSMVVYPGLAGICGTQRRQRSSMATRVVKVHGKEWDDALECGRWKREG